MGGEEGGERWSGRLKDVRLYDRALSIPELREIVPEEPNEPPVEPPADPPISRKVTWPILWDSEEIILMAMESSNTTRGVEVEVTK